MSSSELRYEPDVVTPPGDEIEIVDGDQRVESSENEEVEIVADDAGFQASFVEEG